MKERVIKGKSDDYRLFEDQIVKNRGYLGENINKQEKVVINVVTKMIFYPEYKINQYYQSELDISKRLTSLSLRHKNIIEIYEVIEEEDQFYAICEYCDGGSLQDYIQTEQSNIQNFIFINSEIIEGVDFLHLNSIVHRDLKPKNIFLQQVKQTDLESLTLNKENQNDQFQFSIKIGGFRNSQSISQFQDNNEDIMSLFQIFYQLKTQKQCLTPNLNICHNNNQNPNTKQIFSLNNNQNMNFQNNFNKNNKNQLNSINQNCENNQQNFLSTNICIDNDQSINNNQQKSRTSISQQHKQNKNIFDSKQTEGNKISERSINEFNQIEIKRCSQNINTLNQNLYYQIKKDKDLNGSDATQNYHYNFENRETIEINIQNHIQVTGTKLITNYQDNQDITHSDEFSEIPKQLESMPQIFFVLQPFQQIIGNIKQLQQINLKYYCKYLIQESNKTLQNSQKNELPALENSDKYAQQSEVFVFKKLSNKFENLKIQIISQNEKKEIKDYFKRYREYKCEQNLNAFSFNKIEQLKEEMANYQIFLQTVINKINNPKDLEYFFFYIMIFSTIKLIQMNNSTKKPYQKPSQPAKVYYPQVCILFSSMLLMLLKYLNDPDRNKNNDNNNSQNHKEKREEKQQDITKQLITFFLQSIECNKDLQQDINKFVSDFIKPQKIQENHTYYTFLDQKVYDLDQEKIIIDDNDPLNKIYFYVQDGKGHILISDYQEKLFFQKNTNNQK